MRFSLRFCLLIPFSLIYGAVTAVRNFLYDKGIFHTCEFDIPVISVGNLTVGGTGKTPCTEFIINRLKDRQKIAVLSRGYRRATSGFVLADSRATAKTIGDEPFQIFKKYPEIIVSVDENRRRGINNLLKINPKPDVILLDDAFQHRRVKPRLQILLTGFTEPFTGDSILPGGNLREYRSGAKRADIVTVTKCPQNIQPTELQILAKKIKLRQYQSLFFATQIYRETIPVFPEKAIKNFNLEYLCAEKPDILLVAGIANPKTFIEHVKTLTGNVETMIFADHHAFTGADIAVMEKKFNAIANKNKIILTTEKDAARLPEFYPEELKAVTFALPVEMQIINNQESEFINLITDKLRQ
jgi:tetraacyldisaccharide 4'-kinase